MDAFELEARLLRNALDVLDTCEDVEPDAEDHFMRDDEDDDEAPDPDDARADDFDCHGCGRRLPLHRLTVRGRFCDECRRDEGGEG